jgi:hypothetical protein
VTGPYDDEPLWGRLPGEPAGDDVLELGSDRPPRQLRPSWWPSGRPPRLPRSAAILAVAALVVGVGVGLALGYRTGQHHAAGTPAATASGVGPSAAGVAGGPTLAQTGNLCSQQQGTLLQLGIQVANDSTTPLTLFRVRTVLPMGGLQVVGLGWGPCGELPLGPLADEDDPQASSIDQYLPAQATGWFTVTVKVLGICPSALPVQFQVSYGQHGKISSVPMAGFNDLASVGYSGCPVG